MHAYILHMYSMCLWSKYESFSGFRMICLNTKSGIWLVLDRGPTYIVCPMCGEQKAYCFFGQWATGSLPD